jgi:glycerophosphoryl diester phosphodiesterase
MPLLSTDTARALRSAWRRVLHLWRPMAGWTLLVWAAVATVLVPLSSGLLGWQLLRGSRAVVGNEALVGWLLTPLGLLYLLMAGGLTLTAAVVRYAGLFHIVTDDMEGRPTSVRRTALRLAPRLPALFRLCVVAVAAGLVLAVPLGAGLGGVYALFLGAHDINYYLAVRPAEWRYALVAGGLWALVWLLGAAHVVGRIILALPAYLDGHRPLRTAAARSRELTRGRAARLLRFLAVALALWFVARFLVDAAFFAAASAFIGGLAATTSALRPIVLATAGYAAGTFVLAAVVGFFGFAVVATVLTKF